MAYTRDLGTRIVPGQVLTGKPPGSGNQSGADQPYNCVIIFSLLFMMVPGQVRVTTLFLLLCRYLINVIFTLCIVDIASVIMMLLS